MASQAGWYIGRINVASVQAAKAGTGTSVTDTVFQWKNATTAPTVSTADITGLTAIVGGPYPTKAAAQAGGATDKNTTPASPGTGTPGVSTSTQGSTGGVNLPGILSPFTSVLDAVNGIVHGLTSANLWIRIAKVIGGGLIITVGLLKLTGTDQKIGGIAASAVKVAPLLA